VADVPRTPLSTFDDDALGLVLEDLGRSIAWRETSGLPEVVGARLRGLEGGSQPRQASRPANLRVLPSGRTARRSLLLAAALALLIAGVALGIGFALRGWRVVWVDALPSVPASPSAVDARLRSLLGEPVPIAEVHARVPFPVRLPSDGTLAAPDAAFVRDRAGTQQVSVVWRVVPGVPPASTTGVSMLLTQHVGAVHHDWIKKLVTGDGSVRYLEFDGHEAFWIEGLHVLEYLRPDGTPAEDATRLVERVLVWEDGGVLLRLETGGGLDDALAVARTVERGGPVESP
jgi:hypothetical protein